MTVLSIVFIPAVLICFFRRPFYLLPLLIVASVFEAGSVLNAEIGNFEFGVSPFYFVEVAIFLRLVILLFKSARLLPPKSSPMRPILLLLCAFWAWCFFSAFTMPILFAGTAVSIPREMGTQDFGSLQWSLSNLAQAGYLTLNMGTLVYALYVVRKPSQAVQLSKALYWAIGIVIMIGLAQFVAAQLGLDFPYELLNNNPGYAQGTDQTLGLVRRINSTFTEPSMAGSYLAAVSCGMLAAFFAGHRGLPWLLAILASLTALALTTSSTGFASFAGGLLLMALYFKFLRKHASPRKPSARHWIPILVIIGIVVYVLLSTPDLLDAIIAMTVEKTESYSFWARLAIEIHSLQLTVTTYGLGVGLGSNRSSGLIPTMLSSVGILGTALFSIAFYKLIKLFRNTTNVDSLQFTVWALVTLIISEIVAVPDLNRPVLWALIMIVASQLSVHVLSHPSAERSGEERIARKAPSMRTPRIAPAS